MSGIVGSAGSKSGIIGQTEIDYEEGTFTPSMSDISGSASKLGKYVKIGKTVHLSCYFSDINSGGSSGDMLVTGLPFTSTSSNPVGGLSIDYMIRIDSTGLDNDYGDLHARVTTTNSTTITFRWYDDTGTGANLTRAQCTTGGASIYLTGHYYVD